MNKNKILSKLLIAFIGLIAYKIPLHAETKGKVDLAPAYVHIDILESGKTVKRMDLPAVKSEATILIYKGLCLKPNILYGSGRGSIFNAGLGIGYCLPISERVCLTPSVGCSFTNLRTTINIPLLGLFHLNERFRSISPYVGLDATYSITECWRICAAVQYVFSRTHTKIEHLLTDKSHTKGPNYGIMLERDLNEEWSVQLGAAYNISLSKEKHGLRGYGFKLGLAKWF